MIDYLFGCFWNQQSKYSCVISIIMGFVMVVENVII